MRNLLTTTALTALAYNNADQGTTATLPVGRIVWGHPCKPRQRMEDDGKTPKRDAQGNPVMECSFGLAIPIDVFQQQVWPLMAAEAAKGFPNGTPPTFAWKMKQPHDIDNKGQPYSTHEGHDGHVVLAVSTTLEPPAVFQWDGARWNQMQAEAIKCGDYVQAEINFKVNVSTDPRRKSSLYVNPRQLAFVGYGQEIKTGFNADPNAAFGAGPAALPPGASATPIGNAGSMPGMPGAPAAGGMPGNGASAAMPGSPPQGGMPGSGGMPSNNGPTATTPASPSNPPPAPPAAPAGPQRPTDPTHIHDNGNGTEQWFINGAWDGGAHPAAGAAPATLPPPATGFVDRAAGGMPGAPAAGGMPMMPPR